MIEGSVHDIDWKHLDYLNARCDVVRIFKEGERECIEVECRFCKEKKIFPFSFSVDHSFFCNGIVILPYAIKSADKI